MLLHLQRRNVSFTRYVCSREHSGLPEHLRTQEKRPAMCVHQQSPLKVAAHHEMKRHQNWGAAPGSHSANSRVGSSCSPGRACLHRHFHRLTVQGWTRAHTPECTAWHFPCRRKGLFSIRPAQRTQPQHLRNLP